MYAKLHLQDKRCKEHSVKIILQNQIAIVGTVSKSLNTEVYLSETDLVNLILQRRFPQTCNMQSQFAE